MIEQFHHSSDSHDQPIFVSVEAIISAVTSTSTYFDFTADVIDTYLALQHFVNSKKKYIIKYLPKKRQAMTKMSNVDKNQLTNQHVNI